MLTYAVRWFQTTKKTGSIQMTRKGVSFQGSLYRTKLEGPPSNFVLWSWGFESVSGAEPEFLLTQDMRQPWDSFLIAACLRCSWSSVLTVNWSGQNDPYWEALAFWKFSTSNIFWWSEFTTNKPFKVTALVNRCRNIISGRDPYSTILILKM